MKKIFFSYFIPSIIAGVICISCKKRTDCESCFKGNKPPIAIAGRDLIIPVTSTADSFVLNGTGSNDPDGRIISYLWRVITGPLSLHINNETKSTATAKRINSSAALEPGIYQIELSVKDDDGLVARDSIIVKVLESPREVNAGDDQVILFPGFNNFKLSGNALSNIYFPHHYEWTKISGPSQGVIDSPNVKSTLVKNVTEGVYFFRFLVTNSEGLSSADTIQVTVNNDNLSGQEFIFNNLVWDYESNGNYELEIITPERPDLFYSPARPVEVFVKTGSSGQWIQVPGNWQSNSDYFYWIYSNRLFVFSKVYDPSIFGVSASIRVRFI